MPESDASSANRKAEADRLSRSRDQTLQTGFLLQDKLEDLEAEVDRLRKAGDDMASAIRRRWTLDGVCKCEVCTTAAEWEALRDV